MTILQTWGACGFPTVEEKGLERITVTNTSYTNRSDSSNSQIHEKSPSHIVNDMGLQKQEGM